VSGCNAFGAYPRIEGVPVSGVYYYRASSLVAGGEAGTVAGVGGVSIGRFAWVEPDGRVLNSRVSAAGRFGLVVMQDGDWRRVFWDETTQTWKVRQGFNLTLLSAAPGMWVRLPGGGQWGARVYANPVDGTPVAAYAVGLEATAWSVVRPTAPGGLSLITTWNPVT
jgi:hypothetical protein